MKPPVSGLYAIADTHYLDDAVLVPVVCAAIDGGARIVQYRDKSSDSDRRLRQARALARVCRAANTIFLVNDDFALADASGADGVHLGRDDAPLADARARLGPGATIGVSCYNELDRARAAQQQGADYVAFGGFFPSRTKPQAVRATPALLRQARTTIHVPMVAIGGITPDNGEELLAAGASVLAVVDGVFGQTDVRCAAARYAQLFNATDAGRRKIEV